MDFIRIYDWGIDFQWEEGQPFLISGPCSAETEAQVLETALQLSEQPVNLLRAGIWKPRTRPNSFEGIGEPGLAWLQLAKRTTGIPTCTEVATPEHVALALKYEVDVLWIGARTSANPFAVQAIADALKGSDVPVMVKNPINPDLQLWIGAIERIYNAGIRKIAAIHRGFSVYGKHRYRNQPQWEIPIELRRLYPNLQLICDPSHIGGQRSYLLEIAQQALHLDYDGLMLESHIDPDNALSDAQQQLTPTALGSLLDQLVKPQAIIADPIFLDKLTCLRKSIDTIDYKMLDLLAERMKLVREIGDYKKENNITILQLERWAEIYRTRMSQADPLRISKDFVEEFINAIHKESIRQQESIMRQELEDRKVFKR